MARDLAFASIAELTRLLRSRRTSATELAELFLGVGFRRVEAYARLGDRAVRLPLGLVKGFERLFGALPATWRSRLGRKRFIRTLLAPALRAIK